MNNKAFIKGSLILILFNLLGKIVGAVYRIPLANLLGAEGIGKYQLVFPFFSLLLAISVSGIPTAISKLVAEYNSKNLFSDSRRLIKIASLVLFSISSVSFILIVCLSKIIAKLQGNPDIFLAYYGIAPAILFVGILSVFRGYFQGNLKMMPTAISTLIEQIGKLAFGLYFVTRFIKYGLIYGVFGALIGISISEFFALIYLFVTYLIFNHKNKCKMEYCISKRDMTKRLLMTSIPITLGGIAAPITSIIDSLLVVNLLIFSGYSPRVSTSLLGIESGIVEPIINIPIVISVSIAVSLLPNLTKAFTQKKEEEVKQLIEKAFQIVFSVAISCAICFVVFGKQILQFLYQNTLSDKELSIAIKLLFLGGINLILLSLVQVSVGILQGLGKQSLTAKTIIVGSIIKIVSTVLLVCFNKINIFGAVISAGLSYFIVFLINYKSIRKITSAKISNVYFNVSIQQCFVCLFAFFSNLLIQMTFGENLALFVGGVVAIVVFVVTYYVLFLIDKPIKKISS